MPMSLVPSGEVPQSLTDITAMGEQIAQQALQMEPLQRESQLRELKEKNEVLHSVVTDKLKDIRRQAELAGRQQILGG